MRTKPRKTDTYTGFIPTIACVRSLYGNVKSIQGPYYRDDGRLHIVLYYGHTNTPRTKTVSFPKLLVEYKIGRRLKVNETADHKDRDFTNNELTNLQVLDKAEHARIDAKRRLPENFICPYCGTFFQLRDKKLADATQNRKRGKAGPFCNRSCSGLYGTDVQNKRCNTLEVVAVTVRHTKITK